MRQALGLDSVEILAHSAGTRVALAYAASNAAVRRLALVAPPATWLTNTPDDVAVLAGDRRGEPVIEAALSAGPLDMEDETRFRAQQKVIAPLGYARWDAETQRHSSLGETNFTALQSFFSVQPPDELKHRICDLGIPVHVIGGSVDLLSGRDPVEALAGVFRNGSVEMIDASGHYPWVDQPEAFACAVRRWSSSSTQP